MVTCKWKVKGIGVSPQKLDRKSTAAHINRNKSRCAAPWQGIKCVLQTAPWGGGIGAHRSSKRPRDWYLRRHSSKPQFTKCSSTG